MRWRSVFLWYAGVLVIGSFSSYAAYELPGSDAWRIWSGGKYPWAVDGVRLIVCAIFALFTIWNLGLLEREHETLAAEVFSGWRSAIPILVPIVAIALTCGYASQGFIDGLRARGYRGGYGFYDIYLPYFPYAVYTAAMWGGLASPVFAMLVTRFTYDRSMLRQSRDEFETQFRKIDTTLGRDAPVDFQQSRVAMQNYAAGLKQIAERYIPVLLTVSIVLIYEQLTPSRQTVTAEAQDIGKLGLWLLLGPALLTCMTVVTFNYQSAVRRAESAYRDLLLRLTPTESEVRDKVLEAREHLLWQSNAGAFALSILKSTPVFVLLVTSLTLYVLNNLDVKSRLTLFVPKMLITFFRTIFS